jgi:hypothetical protein
VVVLVILREISFYRASSTHIELSNSTIIYLIRYITMVLVLTLVAFFAVHTHIASTKNHRKAQDALFDKDLEDEVLRKEHE